ncbi:TonB-dependent receptor [Methylophilus sp. OH31]|uniref:TonB-dependent receptor n=1 Tax=Methylophilus sp. OH31 TaxID=1387312 RepID=UPI0004670F1F|nr:TonB-dependent receptor [Methylophilus sp. OH31]
MKPITKPLPLIGLLLAMPALGVEDDNKAVELSEVVVSADFRPKKAQSTAVSLTEIDNETIEARGAQHLEEVLNIAPNVNFTSGASRGQFFQIRGMGQRSQYSAPLNPSVGLVIDGIDFSRTGGAATLFDIDTVEILRGPQGTKFGTNGLAGTINMRSKEPTKDFQMHAETGFAEYNTRNFGAAVGGTIVEDKLLGRASIYSHKSDGYVDNDYLNRDNTQNQDELTFRGKLKLLATEDLTIDLSYIHLDINNGYDGFTLDNSRNSLADHPGKDKQLTNAFAIKTNWQASDAVIVQSEATYLKSDIVYSYDADWGFDGQFDPLLGPYIGFERFDRKRENYSLDLRVLSDKAGRIFSDTTDWTIGLFFIDQDEAFKQNSDFGVFGATRRRGDYDTQNSALYGQLDTHLTDRLTLITGGRIEYFKARYDDTNALRLNKNETLFGGKLGLNYQLNKNQLLYTSLSRGYKSGGVNNDGRLTLNQRIFDAEYNVTLEAGIKSSWFDSRLNTTVAVFYTDRRNAQVKNSYEYSLQQFVDYVDNASSATHKGAEFGLDWFVTDQIRLLASLGLLDATFDKRRFVNNLTGQAVNYDGRDVAQAPNYTFSVGAEMYPSNDWTIRTNVEGKDGFYFSDSNNARSSGYALVNASAEFKYNKHWKMNVWARNLLDKDYATRGFFFGNNPANGYTQEKYVQYAEPRVAGVTVSYDY